MGNKKTMAKFEGSKISWVSWVFEGSNNGGFQMLKKKKSENGAFLKDEE